MIFRKPYAFFIKYFKTINFILVLMVSYLIYRLNALHVILKEIYYGNVSNFANLSTKYIGFSTVLLLLCISVILILIISLLKSKKKPFKDYLLLLIYNFVLFFYFFYVDNLFRVLNERIVEQTELDLYSDISLIVILPIIYFLIKYFLIAIGFNLTKFNFTKDILELKAEETDNEEIELIFNKNTYKYKRGLRKKLRELKYYFLENKFFISIIGGILCVLGISTLIGLNLFDNNKVSVNENFVVSSVSYLIDSVYETKYDLNNNLIKDGYKFVIIKANVKNLSNKSLNIDYKHIRLIYENEYVYANNYFNMHFLDIGNPYNNEMLISGTNYDYIFIFQVPITYKFSKYKLKFYGGLSYDENGEANSVYKTLSINAKSLDEVTEEKKYMLNEKATFVKNVFGDSSINFKSYIITNKYIVSNYEVIRPDDLNKVLLIADYELNIDNKSVLGKLIKSDYDFLNKYLSLEYNYNGNIKTINEKSLKKSSIENKLFMVVPYDVENAQEVFLVLKFRNLKINYKIK